MDPDLRQAAKDLLIRYGGDSFPTLFRSASGSTVIDDEGREILDFTSGQMCATIGHNHPAIVKAIRESCDSAIHLFSGMIPEVVAELGRTLAQAWLPAPLRKSLFVNTGSESNEAALRMAKMHTGGYEVLAIGGSWHGVTGAAAAASFASDRRGYGPTIPGVFVIPEPDAYIVLRAPAEMLTARKGELSTREAERQMKAWDRLATRSARIRLVDAAASVEGTLTATEQIILDLLERRIARRLGWPLDDAGKHASEVRA